MSKLRRGLRPLPLLATMYVLLCGGPFGIEEIIPTAGPGLGILVMTAMVLFWAVPYAMLVAEMVSKLPLQGGIYQWFSASLNRFWSFQFTFLDWLTWVMDAALYPPLVAAYLTSLVTILLGPQGEAGRWFDWGVCLLVIWGCTWLNIRGVKAVGGTSIWMAIAQLLPLVLIVALGLRYVRFSNLSPWIPEGESFSNALTYALIWALWNYSGYGGLAAASEEIVEPERTYPRVLAGFIPLSLAAYVLPLVVGLGVDPNWSEWETGQLNHVAMALGGVWLLGGVALAAQISNLGLFNSELLIISRVPYAMARDGRLPPLLTRLHPRYGTPAFILILQAVLYSVLTYFYGFVELLVISTWLSLPTYLLTFIAPLILRWRRPELKGTFRIPGGWPVLIGVALVPSLIAVYVLFTVELRALLTGLGFIAAGPVLYAGTRLGARWHARRSA